MDEPDSPDRGALLAEQTAYYRARADEYDEWWQRLGRYDHGAEAKQHWQNEVAEVEAALDHAVPHGDVLELACGTGWWTERLARYAANLTCVDAAAEVIAINRARLAKAGLPTPHYLERDLFAWKPQKTYDVVFFSFWLSHVPEELFSRFWLSVAAALKPRGRVFLIDSLRTKTSGARNHTEPTGDGFQQRLLNDGRSFHVFKLFYMPDALTVQLDSLGWRANLHRTERYFIYGDATRE